MRLYSYWRSTTSYRVRAALNLKGLAYDTVPVDLILGDQRDADFMAINPSQAVPALELDDGTVLTQSLAIIDYLDALAAPCLLPAAPLARARVLAAAHVVAMDIHPVNNLRITTDLQQYDGFDGPAWMRHWMAKGFAALEQMIGDATPFAFGNSPDLADLCIVSQVYNANRWGLNMAPYPHIARVAAACAEVPEIHAARPDIQPDAKVTP